MALASLALACSDAAMPPDSGTPLPPTPFVVSSPMPDPSASASRTVGSRFLPFTLAQSVVFVSLPPGAIPNGVSATIRDLYSGSSVTATVINGGFDPVALPAAVGDTLAIAVQTAGGGGPTYLSVVAGGTRPRVVRTDPPSHKRDVPLSGLIVIVFSEPIDSATLNGSTVQLKQGTTLVAGQLAFADVAHLRATFTPNALLTGATDYTLTATQGVTSVSGQPLDSAVTVSFTTGTTAPATGLVFASVSAGGIHSCGVTARGAAYCWGDNQEGALGDGTFASSPTPVAVAGGLTFTSVSAGWLYTCGVTTAGRLYCWGSNVYGQLGDGTLPRIGRSGTPVAVAGGLTFAAVSAGDWHTCGVTPGGRAYCWGFGFEGELGVDSTTFSHNCPVTRYYYNYCLTPVPVAGGLTFTSVSAGGWQTCGVTTAGAAYCWGSNGSGALGIGTTAGPEQCTGFDEFSLQPYSYSCSHIPAAVGGGHTFQQVDVQTWSACGLTTGGAAYCWGENGVGELGDGTTTGPDICFGSRPCTPSPVAVAGGLTFTALSAGGVHACGLTPTGAAYCWGESSTTPVAVGGGLTFATVSNGESDSYPPFTCGLTTAGVAYCWGTNSVPVKVAGQP